MPAISVCWVFSAATSENRTMALEMTMQDHLLAEFQTDTIRATDRFIYSWPLSLRRINSKITRFTPHDHRRTINQSMTNTVRRPYCVFLYKALAM